MVVTTNLWMIFKGLLIVIINFCKLLYMKKIDASYLGKKINKLNKKIHRAEEQVIRIR